MKRECSNCRRWTRDDGSKFGRCAFHSDAPTKRIRFQTRFHETAYCTAWAADLFKAAALRWYEIMKWWGNNGK